MIETPEVFSILCGICIRRSSNGLWVWRLRLSDPCCLYFLVLDKNKTQNMHSICCIFEFKSRFIHFGHTLTLKKTKKCEDEFKFH